MTRDATFLKYLCGLGFLLALSGWVRPAAANERYTLWQSKHPFTQTAWATHRMEGGEKIDVSYFLGSGLNTAFDGVRSGSAAWLHPDTQGLPTLLMGCMNDPGNFQDFLDDFTKAKLVQKHLIGMILGDEVLQSGEQAVKHYRSIRDWIVNHEDPAISSLITITSVPNGGNLSNPDATTAKYWCPAPGLSWTQK